MDAFAQTAALVVATASALTGVAGAWLWWQVRPEPRWWPLLRIAQVLCGLFALAAGVLYLAGFDPSDKLFWLYALLPVGVNFFAEQLRAVSAQAVLDARQLPDAQAVGGLPADQQRSVVRQILRRELGVMTLATLVVAFLALRAFGTA